MSTPTVFRLPLSQVEGRLDPHFYQTSYQTLTRTISRLPHQKLRDLCKFSNEVWDGLSDFTTDFPYLEISDVDLSSGKFASPKQIPIGEAPSRARMKVRHGDFLVSLTRPSRGAITRSESEHPALFIASTGFAVLRDASSQDIHSDYLFHVLRSRLVLDQFEQRSSGGNYPAITEDEMGQVLIPVPNQHLQQQVATLMREAYAQRNELEAQAKTLLESVDGVMYRHLGIAPLQISDATIDKRIFRIPLHLVRGQVLDPKSYRPSSLALFDLLTKTRFPQRRLLDLITHRCAGDWGEDEDRIAEGFTRCLVIRGTEFDNEFNLRVENSRARHRQVLTSKLRRMRIAAGDILIEKSGGSPGQPVGRVAILERPLLDSQPIAYSNFVEKIKVNSERIMPEYLFFYLRFIHSIGISDLLQSQTNGIRNLMMGRYMALPVSVPPEQDQAGLVALVQSIHTQAQTLRQQAQALLEQAKQQVEALILGESS